MSNIYQQDSNRSTAGSKLQHRSSDLRPRLRGDDRGTRKELNPVSSSFSTKIGLRKIPRQILAVRPDAAMIRNARRGVMSKFLHSGIIIRASDLGSMVNPKSAIISLTDTIEMETDHLSDEEDPMPESERTLENLFYICVQGDELPSYHFWRGKDDPDPMNVPRPIDWHGIFHSNALAEMRLAENEAASKQRHSEPALLTEKMQSFSIRNNQMKGENYYGDINSKRNEKRKVQGTGHFSPQPRDSEWGTSLLNFQEPLVRGEDPQGPGHQATEASDDSYETMQLREGELEFLDFYDDKSNEESVLHRRKLAPKGKVHWELDEKSHHLGFRGGDKIRAQSADPSAIDSDTDTSTMNQQRAAHQRAGGILKKAREEEKLKNTRKDRPVLKNLSFTDHPSKHRHFRYNSGLSPESVYKNFPGEIQLPRYTSTLDWEITGGPDMPTTYARIPTLSEIQNLQKRVWHLENRILQREDYCRICDQTFAYGTPDIEEHYREHRLRLVCPCCQQDWREKTRQDQIAHLTLSHQLGPSLAQEGLRTADTSGSPKVSLMKEIVCTFNGCHAPLHRLTADERSDHAEMHARMNQLSHPPNLCSFLGCHVNLNTLKEREREEHTLMHTLTHNTQAPTFERGSSPLLDSVPPGNLAPLATPAPPVNPAPPATPTPLVNSPPGQPTTKLPHHTSSSPHAKTAPESTGPESERERDLHGRILRKPGRGWYCAVCYTNVTTLGLTKQKNHARNCKTTLQEFSVLTKEEATQLKRAANSGAVRTTVDNASSLIETNAASTPSKVVRGQKKKRARGTGAYPPEPSNDLSSFEGEEKNGKRKKRKLSTETTIPPSRTRPRNRNIVG